MSPSFLIPEAFVVVLIAPAASILAAARRQEAASATLKPMLLLIAVCVALSAVAAIAGRTTRSSEELRAIALAHVTLGASAVAFASVGALTARLFKDVLDAAGASIVIALFITFAVLVAGEVAAQLPSGIINAGLVASPLVAVALAANIDVLRDDTWYRLSPIAHRSFNYPLWYESTAVFLAVSLAGFAAFIHQTKRSL